ncbi:hypothetical protein MAR_011588 [Mya arenaria]|uniref:Endonuclease/exonuclease/phosphatase domain-containing protein n=1 Tax=Mya arenaria TaxID=6604 RepID=A0ABY7FXK4_MYAAR|nr:hypothetical protein MAR_011588 [Mya arenaria]
MKVRVKRLTLFRGRHGSSARLKLYPEDEETVEDNSLWPENVTWRRWVSKQEWEREREESRQRRRDHLRHQPYRPYHRYDASYNKRQHRVEDTSSRDNDRNSPWYSDRDDYHDVDEFRLITSAYTCRLVVTLNVCALFNFYSRIGNVILAGDFNAQISFQLGPKSSTSKSRIFTEFIAKHQLTSLKEHIGNTTNILTTRRSRQ